MAAEVIEILDDTDEEEGGEAVQEENVIEPQQATARSKTKEEEANTTTATSQHPKTTTFRLPKYPNSLASKAQTTQTIQTTTTTTAETSNQEHSMGANTSKTNSDSISSDKTDATTATAATTRLINHDNDSNKTQQPLSQQASKSSTNNVQKDVVGTAVTSKARPTVPTAVAEPAPVTAKKSIETTTTTASKNTTKIDARVAPPAAPPPTTTNKAPFQNALFAENQGQDDKDNGNSNDYDSHDKDAAMSNAGPVNQTTKETQQQEQQPYNRNAIKVTVVDPLYQHDPFLNDTEMEILYLAEECLYCWNQKQVEMDFLWEYATPQLRILLRKIQPQNYSNDDSNDDNDADADDANDSSRLLKQLLKRRGKDALVWARFEYLRGLYRQKLAQGFRRPLMRYVIANTRLRMIRGNRPIDFPPPAVDDLRQVIQQQATLLSSSSNGSNKRPKLPHPLTSITVESPPRPAKRARVEDTVAAPTAAAAPTASTATTTTTATTTVRQGVPAAVDMVDPRTGKIVRTFSSLREAAREQGTNNIIIKAAIQSGKSIAGHLWKFHLNDGNEVSEVPRRSPPPPHATMVIISPIATNKTPIAATTTTNNTSAQEKDAPRGRSEEPVDQIDLETKKVVKTFETAAQASMHCRVAKFMIEHALAGKVPSAGGFGWRYSTKTTATNNSFLVPPSAQPAQALPLTTLEMDDV